MRRSVRRIASGFGLATDVLGSFAISGAAVGVRGRLDLFSVQVLLLAAATAGGVASDVLIGATPPAALIDWRHLAVASLAGLVTFYRYGTVERLRNPVQMYDAIGVSLFAVNGAAKVLAHGWVRPARRCSASSPASVAALCATC